METLITRPVEQVLSTVEGVEAIESESAEGISRVRLTFTWGTNLDVASNDTRAYLDRIANRLPDRAERPVVYKFDLSAFPVAFLGIGGSGDTRRLRYLTDDTLSRRLEKVPGVASVNVRGGRVREIRVELDRNRLEALGITAQQVSQVLASENHNVSAGAMLDAGDEVIIRTVGEFSDPVDIANTVIVMRDGRPIYVRDVATVRDTIVKPNSEQWIDGKPGIVVSISKQPGANTVEVVQNLRAEIVKINQDFEGQLRVSELWVAGDFIESAIHNVQSSATYGALLAMFVLLFFLRNVRATLVIVTTIPISVLSDSPRWLDNTGRSWFRGRCRSRSR